jgi:hypothetical protein
MLLIDAHTKVMIQLYDDEHEDYVKKEMTVQDILDAFTDEGCPDAVNPCISCSLKQPKKESVLLDVEALKPRSFVEKHE